MPEKKKKSGVILVIALIALLVVVGIANMATNSKNDPETIASPSPEAAAPATIAPAVASAPLTPLTPEEIVAFSKPRILGNPDAPVKITEHSSFTCNHCAAFHQTNFASLKTDYVDTGKAYIVFDDFPRNQVDIMVGALARCLSGDAYFNFVQLMFKTQADWVNEQFKTHIKQTAMIAGLSDTRAEECMNNKAIHEALATNRQTAQDKFGIESTPQLIINDRRVIPGLTPYDELKKAIEEELAKKAP